MTERQILHILGGSSRCRAAQAHLCFELGYHCETYASEDEFFERPPEHGVVLARDQRARGGVVEVLRALTERGLWFPLIATAPQPRPGNVVEAVKAGALDYLSLPLQPARLTQSLQSITKDLDVYARAQRRMVEARSRIACLSPREREVLDWLAEGCSTKTIARKLDISPRTVENHRANLLSKLQAEHSAEAVRLRFEAHLQRGARRAMG